MGYENFKVAVYCPLSTLAKITDFSKFSDVFARVTKNIEVDKVYIEVFGGGHFASKEKLLEAKKFFEERGIRVGGGLGTFGNSAGRRLGYVSLCYTNPEHRDWIKRSSELAAEFFDEVIIDDFFFTNCKCPTCIRARGDRSWKDFRLELMMEVSRDFVIGPAKAIRPDMNVIIKYPNWYDCYQETGYNQKEQPAIFDQIYTGTETRDPLYTQQHLPKYLGYFLMRYNENIAPGRNGGGWFDIYECGRSPSLYTAQADMTVLAGTKEITLYSLGELVAPHNRIFAPLAGTELAMLDRLAPKLGTPIGTACYKPFYSDGEAYLHGYIGMLGISLEPYAQYPHGASRIFLTESAAADPTILAKVEASLLAGADVTVTSGFVRATQDRGFEQLARVRVTDRRATVHEYGISPRGMTFEERVGGEKSVTLPWLTFATNDTWQIVFGLCGENNLPILLGADYGNGRLNILTVPDNYAELAHLPAEALAHIRSAMSEEHSVELDAPAGICFFRYDNDCFAVLSFLPYPQKIAYRIAGTDVTLEPLTEDDAPSGTKEESASVFSDTLSGYRLKAYRIRHTAEA